MYAVTAECGINCPICHRKPSGCIRNIQPPLTSDTNQGTIIAHPLRCTRTLVVYNSLSALEL
jgi:hypothetical protein